MGRHHGHHHHEHGTPGPDHAWHQHRPRGGGWDNTDDVGFGGPGGPGGPGGRRGRGPGGRGGPPPWMAGLFGLGGPDDRRRGPRVRRGDVRAAVLDVLATAEQAGEPVNGYQAIGAIAERTGEAWRPSPGSVYPTIQLLQDEGLVVADEESGRRALRLTEAGRRYVAEHPDELAAVWAPFAETDEEERGHGRHPDVKAEIGQVMSAVWQIMSSGSDAQRAAGLEVLVDTRRRLYGILADGPEAGTSRDGDPDGDPDGDAVR